MNVTARFEVLGNMSPKTRIFFTRFSVFRKWRFSMSPAERKFIHLRTISTFACCFTIYTISSPVTSSLLVFRHTPKKRENKIRRFCLGKWRKSAGIRRALWATQLWSFIFVCLACSQIASGDDDGKHVYGLQALIPVRENFKAKTFDSFTLEKFPFRRLPAAPCHGGNKA